MGVGFGLVSQSVTGGVCNTKVERSRLMSSMLQLVGSGKKIKIMVLGYRGRRSQK